MLRWVFERFTERARLVTVFAQEEARALKHHYIGTEHVLLGLLRQEEGLAARVLESLGITVERVRDQVVRIVGSGGGVISGQIPFAPRTKTVLEHALREALSLQHDYVQTEDILLGLVRENEGVASARSSSVKSSAQRICVSSCSIVSSVRPCSRSQGVTGRTWPRESRSLAASTAPIVLIKPIQTPGVKPASMVSRMSSRQRS